MDIQQQKSFKVLLIGDSCLDYYVYGEVKRLNPEVPVPILDYKRKEVREGMALNVRNNLQSFGIDVHMLTNDEKIIKTRYIDERSNQQILRVDEEISCSPLRHEISYDYDAIVISDYDKGFITSEFLFNIANNSDIPIFIDSKKTVLPSSGCFVKINHLEYSKLKVKSDNIIVTYGSKGTEYRGTLYPSKKVNVYDVVGAGDTFLAALTFFYLKYGIIERAITFANAAAGIAVSHPGTYVLTENDVKNLCD